MDFHSFAMLLFQLNSSISITEIRTNTYETLHIRKFYSGNVHNVVIISVNPFTSWVTNRYQPQQNIIMETETEKT